MAGGRGAVRKTPKKGASKGSGGQRRRGLEGKGPTPPAHQRETHPAKKRAEKGADKRAEKAEKPAAAKAAKGARGRPAVRAELVVGRNPVVEALRAGVPATSLHVMQRIDNDDRVHESVRLAADAGVALLEAGRPELDRMTGQAVHQGLVLQVRDYEYAHPRDLTSEAPTALVVALDGVTDPRNLGAVTRSVAAFGGHGVLIPGRRSAGVTAGAWKTSAGALARVPVAKAPNLARALTDYRSEGIFVVGLDGAAETEIADVELLDEPLVLVVGSEGRGLSRLVRESCDVVARIPITGGAESLNAGVAAGIALYEVTRRRTRPTPL